MTFETKPIPPASRPTASILRKPSQHGTEAADQLATAAILRDPRCQNLVRERSVFGWTLSIVMLVVYLGFIFAVAFAPEAMAAKVAGTEISLGIVLGLAVIVFAFLLTGVYVARANSRFDRMTRTLTGGSGQ